MENERIETGYGQKRRIAERNGVRVETENGGEKRGTDRNGEWWRETVMPETVVKDGMLTEGAE